MLKKIKNLLLYLSYTLSLHFNPLLKKQRKDPWSIPIIIINYNQLHYLKQQVNFYLKRGFQNIVIIDNHSTYPPLLDYYAEIEGRVKIERMNTNDGHMVFFENEELQRKYGKGGYFLTDADIIPNENLPSDFPLQMIKYLQKYFRAVNKVGFALDINNIPSSFPAKEKVLNWEKKFWIREVEPGVYKSRIDTTFALYKPGYPKKYNNIGFFEAIRLAKNYTAKHGGWYVDPNNLTEEEFYFQKQKNISSSWKINKNGEHKSATKNTYI